MRMLLLFVLLLSTSVFASPNFVGKDIVDSTMVNLKKNRALNCTESFYFVSNHEYANKDYLYVMNYKCTTATDLEFNITATFYRFENTDQYFLTIIKINPKNLKVRGYDVMAATEALDAVEAFVKKSNAVLDFQETDDHWTCWELLKYGTCNRDAIKIYSLGKNQGLEVRIRAKGESNRWENEFLVKNQFVGTIKFDFYTK